MKKYQLIIIGAGSGGLVAAEFAAKLGASVALVEAQEDLGGECLHTGCVPSKALIHAARATWTAGHSQSIGVHATPQVDFKQVMRHISSSVKTIQNNHDNDEYYEKLGIDVIHGQATFTTKHTIRVNNDQLQAKRFIVATGSEPTIPDIPGLDGGEFLTNETIFRLTVLPESLIVIGGGPIGCELGQAFAMLGSKVTILQAAARLLPRDEPDAAALLLHSLQDMDIDVQLNAQIERVSYKNNRANVQLKGGKNITATKLLVATGRTAQIPVGLEKAGVNTDGRGITVNSHLQSSNKHIYAIGDCNGGMQFTHAAAQQAVIAVQNALLGLRKSFDTGQIPWTTFTTPEIGHLGATKAGLDGSRTQYKAVRADFRNIDKAVTEDEVGYIEVLVGGKAKILGATVVGANAAEILAQVITAKSWDNFKGIVQAYPTYAGGLRQAAAGANLEHLLNSFPGKLMQRYIELRSK
jgi:pyruvate/2-oxoglutarate dehydrogenase complex dihydrolipoamide dehydrogenase (E3) component